MVTLLNALVKSWRMDPPTKLTSTTPRSFQIWLMIAFSTYLDLNDMFVAADIWVRFRDPLRLTKSGPKLQSLVYLEVASYFDITGWNGLTDMSKVPKCAFLFRTGNFYRSPSSAKFPPWESVCRSHWARTRWSMFVDQTKSLRPHRCKYTKGVSGL